MKTHHRNIKLNCTPLIARWLPHGWAAVLVATLLTRSVLPSASAQGVPDTNGPAVLCGKAAVTCFGGYVGGGGFGPINPFGFVVAVVDVRDPAANGAVLDQNWAAPMYHGPSSSPWNATNLGQVFGITLDDAMPPNIYVSATTLYGPLYFGPGGPGAVYKLDGTSGAINTFAVLPNGNMNLTPQNRTGPALGNLCFDPVHRQFFVSDFEDGKIYRLDMAGNWSVAQAYDHGSQGRPGGPQPVPAINDDGSVGAMTAFGRRVWGLNVYDKQLFYGVWYQDGANAGNPPNEVWSVDLDATGAPNATTARREFQTPILSSATYSSPVSDISFIEPGRMLLAERTTPFGGAHQSRDLEYNRNLSGQWVNSGKNFYTGMIGLPDSAAGGADYDCKGDVWVTADYLKGTIYGLSHIDGGGNTLATITSASYLIDLNGVLGSQDKTQIGDVVVNRACCQCIRVCDVESECRTNGTYSYTFSVTNYFNGPISHLVFLESPGVVFNPDIVNLSPALNPGQGTVVTVNYQLTNASVTNVCFRMSAHNADFVQCCVIEHCFPVPKCCVRISNECLVCNTNGGWTYDFDFLNVSGSPVKYIYLVADPSGVTVPPIILATPLANGASIHLSVNISPSADGDCPNRVCFIVSAHTPTFALCCAIRHCVDLPACCTPRTYTLDADFDEGFSVNLNHTNIHNQLQVNAQISPFPYVWIAASGRGTVVKIDAATGKMLAEYLSAPDGRFRNPSRTTVDKYGNCWIGNRDESSGNKGSVTRYAIVIGGTRGDKLPLGGGGFMFSPNPNGQYLKPPFIYNSGAMDRDGDGLLKTSRGLGDILPWSNLALADDNGGVSTADDELIITYVRTAGTGARTLAVDRNNDLWVGGWVNKDHEKYSGLTGAPVGGTLFNLGLGGYGGVIDGNNVLWSAGQLQTPLLRFDATALLGAPNGSAFGNYGLTVDPCTGNIWHTAVYGSPTPQPNGATGSIYVRNGAGVVIGGPYGHGYVNSQGVCADQNGNIFVAHSIVGANTTVGHLRVNGLFIGNIPLTWGTTNGSGPTGVAVDSNGKIWASCFYSHNAMRIDPNSLANGMTGGFPVGAVDLAVNLNAFAFTPPAAQNVPASPYNYSDETGFVILGTTCPGGWWLVVRDGCANGVEWGTISWNSIEPAGTSIKVEVRADDNVFALPSKPWTQVSKGKSFCGRGIFGRYLEIRVFLSKANGCGQGPALLDLTVDCCKKPSSCTPTNHPPNIVKCPGPFSFPNSNSPVTLTMSVTVNDPDGDPLTVTWTEGIVLQTDNVPAGAPNPTTATLNFTHTFPPGNHVVIIEVDDGSGHKAICDVIVKVGDHNGPIIGVPKGVSVTNFTGVLPNFIGEHIAVDDNTPPEQIVLTQTPSSGLVVSQGVFVVELTARDLAGNSSTGQTYFAVKPVVTITSPANYAAFSNAPINVSAAIAPNVTGVASVRLLNGGAIVGTDSTPPYSFVLSNLPPGSYLLTAQAVSSNNVVSTSDGVNISVAGAGGTPLLRSVTMIGDNLCFNLPTETGVTFYLEYTDELSPPNWKVLQTIVGDGSTITVTNAITAAPQRFYRVRLDQ